MRHSAGLTRVEGIVLVGVGALLVVLAAGAGLWWHLGSDGGDGTSEGYDAPGGGTLTLRERARRTVCQATLRGFSQAFPLYAADNSGQYPSMGYHGNMPQNADPTATNSRDNLFGQGDCVAQVYWLLVNQGSVSDGQFKCPSDSAYVTPNREMRYGFDDWRNVSYGLQPTTVQWKARLSLFLDGGVVVMADGPRRRNLRVGSAHHGVAGANYLSRDGSVQWTDGGNDVGANGDWIFEPNGNDHTDSYLLWGKVNAPAHTDD